MIIIMLGAPGTGKGTVAGILSKELNIPQISTGDIFRKNISEQTELGKTAKSYMDRGDLVPDEITINMVKNRLEESDVENGAILDGFPRTIPQAEALKEMLQEKGRKIDVVLNLTTPKEEIIERITTRRVCSNSDCKTVYNVKLDPPKVEGICDKCGAKLMTRADDTVEAIEVRLENYFKLTNPLTDYYEKEGILKNEMVSKSINKMGKDVAEEFLKEVKK